jgi:hypothetical protein
MVALAAIAAARMRGVMVIAVSFLDLADVAAIEHRQRGREQVPHSAAAYRSMRSLVVRAAHSP